ncbi:MAG: hypothetical protein K2G41_03105 [Duncaniella sp.]|uniref:hypothetical protein n=1 Tax=Duncaniella sp. TaxID=2518496 RepID=UPI0019892E6D|nr:hypothetical protein [Duncaniella sp.]MBD5314482.1 hypothetical protein [Bacteroides sp.]MBD5335491.1 hypothetical protein [Bacteroides sp.]MDE6089667.1 hypothetical protein [Duncaniella sp.]
MEFKEKFKTVHEDFFGNVVGSIVKTVKKTIKPKAHTDFIADWAIPSSQPK